MKSVLGFTDVDAKNLFEDARYVACSSANGKVEAPSIEVYSRGELSIWRLFGSIMEFDIYLV